MEPKVQVRSYCNIQEVDDGGISLEVMRSVDFGYIVKMELTGFC